MTAYNDSGTFPATADVDASAVADFESAASLPASGSLTATTSASFQSAAALPASGSLTATTSASFQSAAALPASGSLAGDGIRGQSSAATLPATANVTSSSLLSFVASSSLPASASVAGDSVLGHLASSSLPATSTLSSSSVIGVGKANITVTLTVPSFTVASNVVSGEVGSAALSLPLLTISSAGLTGVVGTVSTSMPVPTISAYGAGYVDTSVPELEVSASGVVGINGTAALSVPLPTIAAAGVVPSAAVVALQIPTMRVAGVGILGSTGTVSLSIPTPYVEALSVYGNVGSVALTFPPFAFPVEVTSTKTGKVGVSGIVKTLLPSMSVSARSVLPEAFSAWSIESSTLKHSKYTSYDVLGFVNVNSTWYAVLADGLYSIGGTTDNGTAISAEVLTGADDFGDSSLKRFPYIYFGGRNDGNLEALVKVDGEDTQYVYPISGARFETGLHTGRAKLGRGLRSRYVQIGLRNVLGSTFDVDTLEVVYGTSRKRKV